MTHRTARSLTLRPASHTRSTSRTGRGSTGLLVVAVTIFSAYFLLPLIWLIVGSTKNNEQLTNTFGFLPTFPNGFSDNLHHILTDQNGIFFVWMGNSLLYSITIAVVSTFFCSLAGFAFAKYKFAGKNIMFAGVLGVVMVPNTALVFPIFLLMNQLHLINTYWAVILPGLVNPVGLFLCRLFWNDSLPDELVDSARIDGAGDFRIYWTIGLPLMRNGLVTVALLAFVGAWNNFFLPIVVLSRSELFPVVQGLASWNLAPASGVTINIGVVLLGSLISVVPLVVAFFGLARYWQAGLTVGATKG